MGIMLTLPSSLMYATSNCDSVSTFLHIKHPTRKPWLAIDCSATLADGSNIFASASPSWVWELVLVGFSTVRPRFA